MRTHGETVCFLYFCVLASVVVDKVIIKNIAIGFNIPLYFMISIFTSLTLLVCGEHIYLMTFNDNISDHWTHCSKLGTFLLYTRNKMNGT